MIFFFCLLISFWTVLLLYPYNTAQNELVQAIFHITEYAPMTATELAHMRQVEWYFFATFIITCTLTLYLYYKKPKPKWHYTTLFILLSPLATINFYETWDWLHKIFFPQGNYFFPMDSYLITTVPLNFFLRFSVTTFILATLLYTLWTLVYYKQWVYSFLSSLSSQWSK